MPEPATIDATTVEDAPPGSLVARIAEAMLAVQNVGRDARNTQQNYDYASVETILAAIRRPLLERSVILTAQPAGYTEEQIASKGGTQGTRVVVDVDFTYRDGLSPDLLLVEKWRGEGQDYGDKAYGKAFTNAVKTFARIQWLLPVGTGDDGDADSPERVASSAPAAPAAPAPFSGNRDQLRAAIAELLDVDPSDEPVEAVLLRLTNDGDGVLTRLSARAVGHAAAVARDTRAQAKAAQPATEPVRPLPGAVNTSRSSGQAWSAVQPPADPDFDEAAIAAAAFAGDPTPEEIQEALDAEAAEAAERDQ